MAGLIVIFIFVILMAVPGFYIITRKLFPRMPKRTVNWITLALTLVLLLGLSMLVLGV